MTRCYVCKSEDVGEATDTRPYAIDGHVVEETLPCRRCRACGDVTYALGDGARAEAMAVVALIGRGVGTGALLNRARRSLGLSRAVFADLLGATADAVKTWEMAAAPPRHVFAVLAALADDELEGRSRTRDRLRALAQPPHAPVTVRVTVAPDAPPLTHWCR